jgi:hypothetical protein
VCETFFSEVHRPAASHATEALAIGSGPLPPRAPPEKKPAAAASQNQLKSAAPRPVMAPAVQEMTKTVASVAPAGVPPPTKSSVPKLSQPIPLSSRAPLQPVGRGVAAAFTDHDEAWDESSDRSGPKGAEVSNLRPPSPPLGAQMGHKASMSPPLERTAGRERAGMYGKMSGEKDELASRDVQGGRTSGTSGPVHGDRGMPAASRGDRGDSKGLSARELELGRQQSTSGSEKGRLLSGLGAPGSEKQSTKSLSSRGGQPKDPYGKPKQEMARNAV